MKKYLFYSSLSFLLITLTVDIIHSTNSGYKTFESFNWMTSHYEFSALNVILGLIQGLVLSTVAAVYIKAKTALTDGFRFGMMAGLAIVLVELFIMLIHVNDGMYAFFTDSLLSFVVIQVIGYSVIGYLFGLLFEICLEHEINELPYSFFPQTNAATPSHVRPIKKSVNLNNTKNKLKHLNQWQNKFNIHG